MSYVTADSVLTLGGCLIGLWVLCWIAEHWRGVCLAFLLFALAWGVYTIVSLGDAWGDVWDIWYSGWDTPATGDSYGTSPAIDFGEPGTPGERLIHDEREEPRGIAPPPVIPEQSVPAGADPVERWWD